MYTKVLWSFFLFLFYIPPSQGQNWRSSPWEFFGGIAISNYFGDIGGSDADNTWYGLKDLDVTGSRPAVAAGLRYITSNYLAVSGKLAMGWLSGNDAGGRNGTRGYSFNSAIMEPSVRTEFMPVRDLPLFERSVNRRGMVRNYATLSAYFFGGLGVTFYHVIPNEQLAARQESDNISYGPATMIFPAGLGLKLGINNKTDIGVEIGGRYALNDYLDGFSSDSSTSNDIYYLTSVQMVYRLQELRIR